MRVGMMNNPWHPVEPQMRWAAEQGFDYFDLTLEPPHTLPGDFDVDAVAALARELDLPLIAHSAPHIPVQHPFPGVRRAAAEAFEEALDAAARLGCDLLTTHFMGWPPYWEERAGVEHYVGVLGRLLERGEKAGVRVALENCPSPPGELDRLRAIFGALPGLLWLLDVGHTNIGAFAKGCRPYLEALGERLVHVHLSDNGGDGDDHLPFGAPKRGGVDWRAEIGALREWGYEGTITPEIHSTDRDYLLMSRDKLRRWWGG